MKLTVDQKVVLVAIGAMMVLWIADILGLIDISTVVLVASSLVLAITAHRILPSLEELQRITRGR